MQSPVYRATRLLKTGRRGSSWPVLAETTGGRYIVKLRGAAQGVGALIAEIVVANIAEAVGLPVPAHALVELDADTPTDDKNDELADLLGRSHGLNLGFQYLDGARDMRSDETKLIDTETASKILWLDALTQNPDRTAANPNILMWNDKPWLIDHGAALGFQYNFAALTEDTPRRLYPTIKHLLAPRAQMIREIQASLAIRLDRETLRAAVEDVPDDFLRAMLPASASADDVARRREAYVAYLWKRLPTLKAMLLPP